MRTIEIQVESILVEYRKTDNYRKRIAFLIWELISLMLTFLSDSQNKSFGSNSLSQELNTEVCKSVKRTRFENEQ
jgi:hypothetical protein